MFDTTISELIVKCFTCIRMLPTNDFLMYETLTTIIYSPLRISRHSLPIFINFSQNN